MDTLTRRDFFGRSTAFAAGCVSPFVPASSASSINNEKPDTSLPSQLPEGNQIKITVLKRFEPTEVFNPIPVTIIGETPGPCPYFKVGEIIKVAGNLEMPEGFCSVAWHIIFPTIRLLAFGGNFPWFKEKGIAINSCIDGLRPVIFIIERV
jgi:uncharacterized repeat protein (TIGR04076 family)